VGHPKRVAHPVKEARVTYPAKNERVTNSVKSKKNGLTRKIAAGINKQKYLPGKPPLLR
jgi:hypothetical protein